MKDKDELGRRGEQLAAEYLERAGLRILDRNWRCETGELDIVAARAAGPRGLRGQDPLGPAVRQPVEAVSQTKRLRLRRLAAAWLAGPGAGVRRGAYRRDRAGRERIGGVHPRARAGGGLNAGRPDPLDRPGRGRGPSGRDRSRHPERAPGLLLVGLPDTALREARDRIRAAIVNSREQWPQRRITVGLSPASLPKRGSGFDIGIAVAILGARARSRRRRSTGWRSSASSGSTASCARSAACCPPSRPPRPAASGGSRCRAPTRPRRRWSPACGC